ncbi:hypothetical protein [Butyrivibrio sp. AC2005]|uniref:hypothetical protein n=1 Tax=Butyrivibrio sp. AC2005 TaxID=1280672 RepID=UPI00040F3C1D|nr:hypothetical protein [Butyrivibrio sp. AC2005]
MKGLKQLGAMALAAALTITLAAPLSANAEVITNYDADGHAVSYTNEDTGKTSKFYDEVTTEDKAITIATQNYGAVKYFRTTAVYAKFANFKSNKKGLKVKVIKKDEYTDPNKDTRRDYDDWDDDNYYYKNANGDWITVPNKDWDKLPKGKDWGEYTVRLYAKKAGTYKLKYDAILKDGTTVKKTLKVIAKADGSAIKSVTFGGKVIAQTFSDDKIDPNTLWTKNWGMYVTTAKSGKIRVTMNKDFKLKKIEVGTPIYKEIPGTAEDNFTKRYEDAAYASSLERYNDMTISWKKVKNGKKIKLNKDDSYVHTYLKTHNYIDKETSTFTYIRITYYDKKNKETRREYFGLYKVNK